MLNLIIATLARQVTVSTGCWPQRHGIVGNRFLDPQRGIYDHFRDPGWLLGCEDIDRVAERRGLRAAWDAAQSLWTVDGLIAGHLPTTGCTVEEAREAIDDVQGRRCGE